MFMVWRFVKTPVIPMQVQIGKDGGPEGPTPLAIHPVLPLRPRIPMKVHTSFCARPIWRNILELQDELVNEGMFKAGKRRKKHSAVATYWLSVGFQSEWSERVRIFHNRPDRGGGFSL